jgi:hypothetical protein
MLICACERVRYQKTVFILRTSDLVIKIAAIELADSCIRLMLSAAIIRAKNLESKRLEGQQATLKLTVLQTVTIVHKNPRF